MTRERAICCKRKEVEKANKVGVREVSRLLGIPRKNLQHWRKQMVEVKSAVLTAGIKVWLHRRIRQSNAKYQLLESAL